MIAFFFFQFIKILIENVSRLKDLRYLNLALNNVTKIENLGGTCVGGETPVSNVQPYIQVASFLKSLI